MPDIDELEREMIAARKSDPRKIIPLFDNRTRLRFLRMLESHAESLIAAARERERLSAENGRLSKALQRAIEAAYVVGCQAVIDAALSASPPEGKGT